MEWKSLLQQDEGACLLLSSQAGEACRTLNMSRLLKLFEGCPKCKLGAQHIFTLLHFEVVTSI